MLEAYLCDVYHCSIEQLLSKTIQLIWLEKSRPFIKIMSYKDTTIIQSSSHFYRELVSLINNKSLDELFELPYIYGYTLHYVYPKNNTQLHPLNSEYQYLLLEDHINDYEQFSNAVDKKTVKICVALKNGEPVGVAGASLEANRVYEIGVDVNENYRGLGIASQIVQMLSENLIKENNLVIYSASITNIPSQKVAIKSGFQIAWIDTFGTIGDDFDVYKNIRGLTL